MNKGAMLILAALAALAGCSSESGTAGSGGTAGGGGSGGMGGSDARACATDIDVGEDRVFGDPTPLLRSEGITFDADGRLYVSAQDPGDDQEPDQLIEVMLDGSNDEVASAPSILGLESDARGILGAGIQTANLLLFDPTDWSDEEIATGLGEPNFVVTTPWGTILVSDDRPGEGSILEVTWEGDVTTWSDEVPTPNGMVFSLDGGTLYVAATFEEAGLWRIPVSGEGAPGVAEKWVPFDGTAPDGIAIDSEGNVYVALNAAGQIAKVDPEGNSSILATGMTGPASLAFGQGDFDPCSLYVTSLFIRDLYRVGAGVLGVEK
jgi:DNA-binding beta-propeller fold protein YncE